MHEIEPYYNWLSKYDSSSDERSPFHGKEYNYDVYSENIYGYYIDPAWDFFGSETLYMKVLFADYDNGFAIFELIGEWNDAINNDIMHMKRNIIEHFGREGIFQYIIIGENVLNFHGSDDCYYEEWFEDVEENSPDDNPGWIALINFRDFVLEELSNYNIDSYLNYGGTLQIHNWRTFTPQVLHRMVKGLIMKRIALY